MMLIFVYIYIIDSREYQTSASAFAQMLYNMLAYFASPLFSGFIMDLFSDKMDGMLWGLIF